MRKNTIILLLILSVSIIFLLFSRRLPENRTIKGPERPFGSDKAQTDQGPHQSKPTPKGSETKSPADAGFVKGLGRDVIQAELEQWAVIGFVKSYEFRGRTVTVYMNQSDWISLPYSTKADFKAGIRSKWPDGSVVFRDSQTGERL